MLNRNLLEFHFADHSYTLWMQKALIELWRNASNARLPEDARKEIIEFVQTLPMHNRRKESEEDFIMRHVLIEIEKRSRHKWKSALNTFPSSYLSDYHIRGGVWDYIKNSAGLGGLVNEATGISAVYMNDTQKFIYHFHDRPIPLEELHPDCALVMIVEKDVVVFLEYSTVFFNDMDVLKEMVIKAIKTRMGE